MHRKHIRAAIVTLGVAFVSVALSGAIQPAKRMRDGKQWTTNNLNVNVDPSYCYEDAELNCRRYGRLYTWESAQRGCRSLGNGWRLPTTDDWTQLAKQYGGVLGDSDGDGRAAYKALSIDGSSGFNAVLGGGRSQQGEYARLDAHGLYWTASETDSGTAWIYNFGRGGQALSRHSGENQRGWAFSVRCVRE